MAGPPSTGLRRAYCLYGTIRVNYCYQPRSFSDSFQCRKAVSCQGSYQYSTTQPKPIANRLPPPSPPPPPAKLRRSIRPYIYAAVFFLLGYTICASALELALPPPFPVPGSPEDSKRMAAILKGMKIKDVPDDDPQWKEIPVYADGHLPTLTTSSLGGSRGLGVQRLFWNEAERKTIHVAYIGGHLTGWPGIVHGGLIAILARENLDRLLLLSGRSNSHADPDTSAIALPTMGIDYKSPVSPSDRYLITTTSFVRDETEDPVLMAVMNTPGKAVCAVVLGSQRGQMRDHGE